MLLKFAIWELTNYGGASYFGAPLMGALISLENFMQLCRDNPVVMDERCRQHLLAEVDIHLRCCKAAKIHLVPKHHQVCHLADRMHFFLSCVQKSYSATLSPSTPALCLLSYRFVSSPFLLYVPALARESTC